MSTHFKPVFWHPDKDKPGLHEERQTDADKESSTSFVYNSYHYLSLEQQRQKLPIFKNRNHILYLLETFQILIIVGETGSGKSTQIPQYLVEAGWGDDGKIVGITQPRRIAATTLASRVADEKGCLLGGLVGYCIRFDECISSRTKIKFLTEGILIREMMSDPLLSRYSVIMVDEAHERSINTDILLGLLKKILKKRSDLRLIISSATLEADEVKDFFNRNDSDNVSEDTARILTIEGRLHPVEINYIEKPVPNYMKSSVETTIKIHESCKDEQGNILIFLTGQEEVEQAIDLLIEYARQTKDKNNLMKLLVLSMYGALPYSDQLKVFKPTPRGVRKIVVATNIAEASVTIPGIVYVIDCGFVKLKFFNPNTVTDSLVIVPLSQASAIQRAGRAGRVRPGKAFRLYPEDEFDKLSAATPPEITRSSLAYTILQMKALGIDNVLRFDYLTAPPSKNMVYALELLYALGALSEDGKLTVPIGMQMAEFPLHPMFSKMLLSSAEFGCTEEAMIICAMLQVQNVFVSPFGQAAINARKAKHAFSVSEGDHLTLLNAYTAFKKNPTKAWCGKNFLNYKGLVRATQIKEQLEKMLRKFKIKPVSCEGDTDTICRCVVSGFFSNAAYLHHSGTYRTIRGDHTLHIHPSSVLYTEKQPQWIVYGEVLHTSMEFMRDATAIDPKWLYELAPHFYRYGAEIE